MTQVILRIRTIYFGWYDNCLFQKHQMYRLLFLMGMYYFHHFARDLDDIFEEQVYMDGLVENPGGDSSSAPQNKARAEMAVELKALHIWMMKASWPSIEVEEWIRPTAAELEYSGL